MRGSARPESRLVPYAGHEAGGIRRRHEGRGTRDLITMQMPREIGTFHIIGIGGIGMSAIAEILLAKGYSVQGSDQKDSANVRRLRAKGVRVFIGHDPVNLVGARSVVISSAVKSGNPELRSLSAVLKATGLRIAVKPIEKRAA